MVTTIIGISIPTLNLRAFFPYNIIEYINEILNVIIKKIGCIENIVIVIIDIK